MQKKENNAQEVLRRRRRRRRQLLGFCLCALAVLGVVSLVQGGARLVRRMFDDSELRAEYEQRLTYVVMLDMLPFSSLRQANQTDLLESCIWAAVFREDNTLYDRNEMGALLLPSAEVDRYAAQLFGPDYSLTHATFESNGMVFEYDEETRCYVIPITSQVGSYTPRVVEISGSRSLKRVTVGYLQPYTSAGDLASNRDVNQPVKYADYLFARAEDGNYYLTAMENSEWTVPASSEPTGQGSAPAPAAPDPNSVVGEITGADTAVQQELQNAQSAGDAAPEDGAGGAGGEDAAESDLPADEAAGEGGESDESDESDESVEDGEALDDAA